MRSFGRYLYAAGVDTGNAVLKMTSAVIKPSVVVDEVFQVKPEDVLDVKEFFFDEFKLPAELIDTIIDFAEYWPHTTSIFRQSSSEDGTEKPIYVRAGDGHENKLLVSYLFNVAYWAY